MTRNTGYDRARGILTPPNREFIDGVKEYENRQSRYEARENIKSRLRNAVLDFEFLYKLDEDERREVFTDMEGGDDLYYCLTLMGAFACRAARDAGTDPEDYLSAVADTLYSGHVVMGPDGERQRFIKSASVDLHKEWVELHDPDVLYERFQDGETLSAEELGHLVLSDQFGTDDDFAALQERLSKDNGETS